MISLGEIHGGCNRLKHLLYPFHGSYPLKLWSKYRWWRNRNLKSKLSYLNQAKSWLTVIDRLGSTRRCIDLHCNVIRCIKEYSHLKINCITPHPELIRLDPSIDSINCQENFYSFDSTYWELIVRKEKKENIIAHNLERIGIQKHEYRAKFYLSEEERNWAKQFTESVPKPMIAICTRSKESVKIGRLIIGLILSIPSLAISPSSNSEMTRNRNSKRCPLCRKAHHARICGPSFPSHLFHRS